MKKILCLMVMVIGVNIHAWEINTHRAIEHVAIGKSTNLKKFINSSKIKEPFYEDAIQYDGYGMTYLQYIIEGEDNGISDWNQTFSNDKGTAAKIKELIEAGAILEDAQWPHPPGTSDTVDQADGRFVNHFYDAQEGGRTSDMRIINILESVL